MTQQNSKKGRTFIPITNQITISPYVLSAKMLSDWVSALNSANSVINPNRRKLYELYNKIELDAQIETVKNLRTIALTNKTIQFVSDDGTDIDPALMQQLRAPWFQNMINEMMAAKFWGHSLIEFVLEQGVIKETKLVPRVNVVPEKELVAYSTGQTQTGIYYKLPPESNYCFEVWGQNKLGLYSILAPYVLYKTGALGDLSQFCELFALPFREMQYEPTDPDSKRLAKQSLEEMGSAGHIVTPSGTTLKFHQTNQTGFQAPETMVRLCDEQIAKAALGGTMTTDNGSSQAQAKIHYEVKSEINLSDMIGIEYHLNWVVKPLLIGFGLPLEKGSFRFDNTREIPLENRVEMDKKLAEEIVIPAEYWYKTYKIQEPEGGPQLKTKTTTDENTGAGGHQDKKGKKQIKLMDAVSSFYTVNHVCNTKSNLLLLADQPEDMNKQFNEWVQNIYDKKADAIDRNMLIKTAEEIAKGILSGFTKDMYTDSDANVLFKLLENTWSFAGAKTYQQGVELNKLLVDGEGKVRSFSDFKAECEKVGDVFNKTWLQTEYNHAVGSSQMASKWSDFSRNEKNFPNLQYMTVGDSHVREAHRALEGVIRPVNDAFWNTYYPPNGWGCRCNVISIDNKKKVTDPDKIKYPEASDMPKTFQYNVGKTGKAFPEDMPMFDNSKEAKKAIEEALKKADAATRIKTAVDKKTKAQ